MSEFEKFCEDNRVSGNFKEALFHACAADYGLERIEVLTREEVAGCWKTVLFQALGEKIDYIDGERGNS